MAVSNAVKAGRLKDSVTRDENGSPKIADPDLADREWEANTSHEHRERAIGRPEGDETAHEGMSLAESSAIEKLWKARTAELKFREAAGELVRAAEAQRHMEFVFAEVRSKLLGVPSRLKQRLPHVAVSDVEVLEDIVRESLEALCQP